MSQPANPFRYFHSSPEIIRLAVLMYVRFPLSLRNVEDLLFERGIDMLRAEPALIVMVGDASFRVLTGSGNGAELLLRLYQSAFELAAAQTGYSVETMTNAIFETFIERAEGAGEGSLESVLHQSTRGLAHNLDSRTYQGGRRR